MRRWPNVSSTASIPTTVWSRPNSNGAGRPMEVQSAEAALAQQSAPQPTTSQLPIAKALNSKVVALAGRLPQIWADPATTDAQRRALLRCLVEKVVLDRGTRDLARVRIGWRGGAVTDLEVRMRVNSIANLTRGGEMRDRLLDLARPGMPDDEIAAVLTGEGHRSAMPRRPRTTS
jgi:hypothetical protein